MGGSLNEAERPEQSPVTADQARPVMLSVVIDGRLDAARARQVATLTHRLGLAGVWLRYPWWPLSSTGMSGTEPAGQLAALASGVPVPLGLLVDADAADLAGAEDAWLDRLVQASEAPARAGVAAAGARPAGFPASPRIALAASPAAVARGQGVIGRRPGLAATRLGLPVASSIATPAADVFVPCAPGRNLAGE